MKYFAYGLDLDMRSLVEWTKLHSTRVPARTLVGPATLANYRLCFPAYSEFWQGGVADLAPEPGKSVAGALFDLSSRDLNLLDRFFNPAGTPALFRRVNVTAELSRGRLPIEAVTFQATVHDVRQIAPSRDYIERVIAGAYAFGLSTLWIMQLQSFCQQGPLSTASVWSDQQQDLGDLILAPPAA